LQEQADYWEKYIMEKIPVARLPYDYEDHASPKEPSKIYQLKLDEETAKKLDEVAQLYFDRFHSVLNQFVTSLDLHMSQFPPLGMNELEEIF
jgi:hypothetical protein